MSAWKGFTGELRTSIGLWWGLDTKTYRRFNNVIVPTANGTAQIDHLIVSPHGLFIVETKNYSGWIYGSEDQSEWTKVKFQSKYRFQNPLRQMYRQAKSLSETLALPIGTIHRLAVFVGDCKFKTAMPENVLRGSASRYIRRFRTPVLSAEDQQRVADTITSWKRDLRLTHRMHVRSLHERHTSTTTCPRCAAPLVARVARKGANEGSQFLGCSSYPKCKFTRDA